MPIFSISFAALPVGLANLMNEARSTVPAVEPSNPAFDMISIAAEVSSIDTPNALAGVPAYFNASPM